MASLTAGPWIVWAEENTAGTKVSVCHHTGDLDSEDHQCVATAKGKTAEEAKANAHLIAAAPDLYAALDPSLLESIADELSEHGTIGRHFENSARIHSLRVIAKHQRAALAKAEVQS